MSRELGGHSPLDIMRLAGAAPEEIEEAAAYIAGDPRRAAELVERARAVAERRWPAVRRHPELIKLIAFESRSDSVAHE